MKLPWRSVIELGQTESQIHDWLRLLLLVQVIMGHALALFFPTIPEMLAQATPNHLGIALRLVFRFGIQSAYIFVFLSGYMVGGKLLHEYLNKNMPKPMVFATSRVARIAPIAMMALVLTATFDGAGIGIFMRTDFYRHVLNSDALAAFSVPVLIGNILFLEPTFVPSFGSNGPLWTLGYIVQFYVFGFVSLYAARFRSAMVLLGALGILASGAVFCPEWSVLLLVWVAGSVVRNLGLPVGRYLSFAIPFGIGVAVAANQMPPLLSAAASGLAGALMVIGARTSRIRPINRGEILRRLSGESFTAYAVHFPVLTFVAALCPSRSEPFVALVVGLGACAIVTVPSVFAAARLDRAARSLLAPTPSVERAP